MSQSFTGFFQKTEGLPVGQMHTAVTAAEIPSRVVHNRGLPVIHKPRVTSEPETENMASAGYIGSSIDSGLGIKEGVIEAIKFMTTVKTFSLPW